MIAFPASNSSEIGSDEALNPNSNSKDEEFVRRDEELKRVRARTRSDRSEEDHEG